MINIHKDTQYKVRSYKIYPLTEAIIATLIISLAVGISSYFIFVRSDAALKDEIKEGLLRTAAVTAATIVDGDLHKRFTHREQEKTAAYRNAVNIMGNVLEANKEIHFVYTGILKNDEVYFVLDPTPEGDSDGDGIDDKAHIMDIYDEAPEEMVAALREKRFAVSEEPYTDRWGTFVSGYAPFYDRRGNFVGVLALDLEVSKYKERLKPIWQATMRAMATGLFLSFLTGAGVWFTRRFASEINASRQRIMKDLEEAVQIARNAAKAKSEFLANMSHEIRTPMNAILGFTKTLMQGGLNPVQQDHVETIQEAGNSLIGIINEILDLSKIEAGKVALHEEDFDLHRCVDNVVNLLSTQSVKKNIELCTFVGPDVPQAVNGDQGRIRQILINLLGNAIKFTEDGGVSLELMLEEKNASNIILRCNIIDTGIGIAPDNLQKVFDEFSQANKSIERHYGGTGLGLAITKKLVHLMLGDITVDSTIGKGTTFSFTLQLNLSQLQIPQAGAEQRLPNHVLIAGVSEFQTDSIEKQLKSWDVRTDISSAGELFKTLTGAVRENKPYDTVLIDGTVNELEFLVQKIKTHIDLKHLRILLLRDNKAHHPLEDSDLFDGVVSKPIRHGTLRKAISTKS